MAKITPQIKQKILEDLLKKEQQEHLEKRPVKDRNKPKTPRSDTLEHKSEQASAPKNEFLKIALVTMICLGIIVIALWIDIKTDLLTQFAHNLAQALHI